MRGLRSTLALFAVALGLGAYIYFIEAERPTSGTPDALESVFDFESDDITSLSVDAENGDRTVIRKTEDRWILVEPVAGNVDVTAVVGLTSSVASLEMQRIVAESEDAVDLDDFGLAAPRITVAVETTGGTAERLLIGARTPTGGDVYATIDGSNRVFLISGFLDDTFNQTTFDLRDKTILDFTGNQADSLRITGADIAVAFRKTDDRWSLVQPIEAGADFGVTNGIVSRLSTGRIASVEAEQADDLAPYGLDAPRLTVEVGLGGSTATLTVGGDAPSGNAYARDSTREMVFTIDQTLVADLRQGADEYRRKDLFAFRPFNAQRLEVERDGEHRAFEKSPATDEAAETWRQTDPENGAIDTAAMDDLLSRLSSLRADGFVAVRDATGLDAPLASFRVTFDDGDEERVTVGRVEDEVFGVNGGEPGAARLETSAWDAALEALDALDTVDPGC